MNPQDYEEYLKQLQQQPWHPPMATDDMPQNDVPEEPTMPRPVARAPQASPVQMDIPSQVKQSITDKYGYPQGLGDEDIKAAQEQAADTRFYSGLGEAFSGLSHSIAGDTSPQDNSFYQNMAKGANQPVENILTRRKGLEGQQAYQHSQMLNDPNSMQAKMAQQVTAGRLGIGARDLNGMSVSDLADLEKMVAGKEGADVKKLLAEIKSQGATDARARGNDEKTNKRFSNFGEALDENKGRTGEFGRQAQFVNNSDRVLVLGQQFPDGNLPPAQMGELAQATAALVSGGSHGAEATVKRYVPHTFSGSAAGIEQWLSSDPKGAKQQGFAKLMFETANREKSLAQGKIEGIKYSRVAQFGDLEKRDPETFNAVLMSHGIEPDKYKQFKAGGYRAPQQSPAGLPGQDKAAVEWAQKNKNDPRAQQILQMHGM